MKPLKPCFNFYGLNKSEKPKLNLFLNPTVRSLFPTTQPADSASPSWTRAGPRPGANSDAKRGQKVVSPRVEVLHVNVSGTSTSPWAATLSWPGAGRPRALLTVPGGAPSLQEPAVTTTPQSGVAFASSRVPGGAGRRFGGKSGPRTAGAVKALPGRLVRGAGQRRGLAAASLILWIVHPSAHCEDGAAECPEAVQ